MFKWLSKTIRNTIVLVILFFVFVGGFKFFSEFLTFKKIIHNLKAESRMAEVLVVESSVDEFSRKFKTTIKFLEYDVQGKPLKPKFFTFNGNLIQFQTLVVRFDDRYIEEGHRMKGKSICLFLKAFVLDGAKTQQFVITPVYETKADIQPAGGVMRRLFGWFAPKEIRDKKSPPEFTVPEGYRVGDPPNYFEREIWGRFWRYALDPDERKRLGIKNAQVEAPGQVFVPGTIYTLALEHDGGIRIDTRPIPEILKNEDKAAA